MDSMDDALYQYTFTGAWEKVVKLYETKPAVQVRVITSSKDTALHMAISDDREEDMEKMVGSIVKYGNKKALEMKNNRGETPLHRAATRKSVTMCKCIVKAGQDMGLDLLSITNKWGETPIFTAALYNRKPAFTFLHRAAADEYSRDPEKPYQFLTRTGGSGDTALHSVIRREHFDLAFHMIKMCPELMVRVTEKGMTPLHVLASKPSAFRSGLSLSWWKQIIYYFLGKTKDCMRGPAKSSCSQDGKKKGVDPEAQFNSYTNESIPQNYTTCYELMVSVCLILFHFSGFDKIVNKIREEKEKHEWSVRILMELMEKHNKAYINDGGNPEGTGQEFDTIWQNKPTKNAQDQKGKDGDVETRSKEKETYTPLLVAAQKGVIEVVNEILSRLPVTIYDTTSKGKNILQVAVENRQPRVIEAVQKQVENELKPNLWADLIQSVDADENTILHLAAKYKGPIFLPWQIHGAAMQVQWEIKWYEYVKSLSPHHFLSLSNAEDQNPEQIFTTGHEKMVDNSIEWLNKTSESCSVVAALVAGVSFATSSQVPGGTNGDTGKPNFERRPAFELFAITSLIALCFSVTALIMFLSILTSRKLPRDFKKNLPLKILLGLSSLFVSIASMLISFCAAHFFVLEDRFKTAVFALYTATCLPVSIYAVVQFPLYMDLLKSIMTKVPESLASGHV